MATETSTYGYFPMLPFLIPARRQAKVEWLMDRYAEVLALYPNANFSFVGHSNGTYLLARAMHDYPACRFENAVLAGSVVSTNYDWASMARRGQVRRVLNFVATADYVVASVPRAIQMLRLQDLGSAGHDGFPETSLNPTTEQPTPQVVSQVRYVRGKHGAALVEANWDSIAQFILKGTCDETPSDIQSERRNPFVVLTGLLAPVLCFLLILAIVWVGYLMWPSEPHPWLTDVWYHLTDTSFGVRARTLFFVAYVWFIWKIITAF